MAFLCFSKGNNHLGIKKGLKNAILTLFLASFLFPLKVLAKQMFTLDICQLNQAIHQCYPDFTSSTYQIWTGDLITTNDYYYSSPYSGKNSTNANAGFEFKRLNLCPNYGTEKRHRLDFKFRYNSFNRDYINIYILYHDNIWIPPGPYFLIRPQQTTAPLTTTTITFYDGTSYQDTIQLLTHTWYETRIFSYIDNNAIRYYKIRIINTENNTLVFEKEYTTSNNLPIFTHYINIYENLHRLDDFIYYCQDDITETGEEYIPTGYHPIWNLEKPTPCQPSQPSKYNQVSTPTNFEVKGKITIPIENPYTWYKLRLRFWNNRTNNFLYFDYDLPNLTAGQSYNFDYFVDISSILSTSTDLIDFTLKAYAKDNYGNVFEDFYPFYCVIYLGLTPTQPIFTPPEIQFPPQPELEDCSQYNIPDRWICEIKNALKSIFLPSSEKINQLKQTTDLFKQKFPFNYINLFTNFYQDIHKGINETSTIQFKILGQSGNVDLAFWENQATIGGITQTFSHIIYNIFLFLFLFIFVLWLISYLKRIF